MNKHDEVRNYRKQELKDLLGYIPRKELILQYIAQAEQNEKELELYKAFFNSLDLRIEYDSTDGGFGESKDFCVIVSDNDDIEFYDSRIESLELFDKLLKAGE